MKKIIILMLFIFVAFSVEVTIKSDTNNSVLPKYLEVDAFKSIIQERMSFNISDKGANKLTKENRALANEYIKRFGVSEYDRARIRVESEMYLANKMVKNIQQSIKIPEKVLYSYYLDHKKEFRKKDKVDAIMFFFKNPDDAINFYLKAKKDILHIDNFLKKYEVIKKEHLGINVEKLKPVVQRIVKKNRSESLIPPLIGNKYTIVMYIKSYNKSEGYKSFKEVKEKIRNFLYKKTFIKERENILKQYGIKND